MTVEEAKSILIYGINVCELTKTKHVHITLNEALSILDILEKATLNKNQKGSE